MIIEVTPGGPTPPYEQVRSQLETMVVSGTLPSGHRLPSIRQLATDLGLAPGTIARAYRELEAAGLVVSRVGRGTTVSASAAKLTEQNRRRHLADAARHYAATVQRLGATRDQALAAVTEQFLPEPLSRDRRMQPANVSRTATP